MTSLQEIGIMIGIFAMLGAFVDFYIGKGGQRQVRDLLETLWIRMSDTTMHTLARAEASYAESYMTKIFGRRLFSVRKIRTIFILFSLFFISIMYLERWEPETREVTETQRSSEGLLFSLFVRVSLATYLTIALARALANSRNSGLFFNICAIALLFVFQMCVLMAPSYYLVTSVHYAFSSNSFYDQVDDLFTRIFGINKNPFGQFISDLVLGAIQDAMVLLGVFTKGVILSLMNIQNSLVNLLPWKSYCVSGISELLSYNRTFIDIVQISTMCVDYTAGYIRILMFMVFLLTLSLTPLIPFILTLMLRIIESDKPVFTLIFGGLAALIKSVQELLKLL